MERWNDVRGNGMFATNCLSSESWRTDPEKRKAFISEVTQNCMPVVDFGSIMSKNHTDAYGAAMKWSKTCTNAFEVYQVVSDTPDVAEANIYASFVSSPDGSGYRGTG